MYIGFSHKINGLFSKGIRKATKSDWSHVFLVLDQSPVPCDSLILESTAYGGVKFNLLSYYTDNPKYKVSLISIPDLDADLTSIKQHMGSFWGFLQSIGYILARLLKLKKNPLHDGIWCSELILLVFLNSNYKEYFQHLDLQKTTPGDLYKVLKVLDTLIISDT
jgi:hypothetical protein